MSERHEHAPVPEHVSETVETITQLRLRGEEDVTTHQRSVEALSAHLGRPRALYIIALGALGWAVVNVILCALGQKTPDPPPFVWLQGVTSLGALLMATTVLTTQNRQRRLAEERAALDLQVNLLSERKLAKLIALVEELRRDMPNVRNRTDSLAEAMTRAVDPHAVASAIQEGLDDATAKRDRSP